MILDIPKRQPSLVRKTNWKDQFRAQLYAKNQKVINEAEKLNQKIPAKNAISIAGEKIMTTLEKQTQVVIIDKSASQGCHSYYSSYIPLKEQTKFDDQFETTFPYIKFLTQKGRINDRQLIVNEMGQHMRLCREKRMQQSGWKECLQKYICGIDSIRAIELFIQLKKCGTIILKQLHDRYSQKCEINVFFHRITLASKYFGAHKEQRTTIMPLSLEATDQINEKTMPKTLKMLFCTICLIYDCTRHSLDDEVLQQKSYQYLSPQNILSEEEKLFSAIKLCLAHNEFLSRNQLEREDPCQSTQCYKRLTARAWQELERKRATLMSPLVKGLIKLGIEMHGYDPCSIWPLVHNVTPHKEQSKLNCALVFLFFIEQYDIYTRLERKLANNEIQMLKKEAQGEIIKPEPPRQNKKKKNKVIKDENTQILTTCSHYFVGQLPCDQNCTACICTERGYCFPQCLCSPSCPLRKKGCSCKRQDCRTKKCPCYNQSRQCDPAICLGCFSDRSKCRNNAILLNRCKRVRVGRSTVPGAGLGLFAAQTIQKEEFVMIYAGQIIDPSVDMLRQSLSVDLSFYNFNSPEGIVDARFMGNASRFINHGNEGQDNLRSEDMLCGGRYKIAFFANRTILEGEQLFFNYDGQGLLYQNHREKYPFIRPSSKKASKSMKN